MISIDDLENQLTEDVNLTVKACGQVSRPAGEVNQGPVEWGVEVGGFQCYCVGQFINLKSMVV